ncbi:hypothetical protein [Mycobacterium angelicum]|uniref:hypothetical protein n=1 Tax=Mycobacterium angelicum TaxID=470074 RepID=UPI00111C8957|nr:hypothetical protein [Mycobacterium angelicum]MCV7195396.1 hypothetical protein [Mycobacterium angelicum]
MNLVSAACDYMPVAIWQSECGSDLGSPNLDYRGLARPAPTHHHPLTNVKMLDHFPRSLLPRLRLAVSRPAGRYPRRNALRVSGFVVRALVSKPWKISSDGVQYFLVQAIRHGSVDVSVVVGEVVAQHIYDAAVVVSRRFECEFRFALSCHRD